MEFATKAKIFTQNKKEIEQHAKTRACTPTYIHQPDDVLSLNDMSDDATIWKKKDRIIIFESPRIYRGWDI